MIDLANTRKFCNTFPIFWSKSCNFGKNILKFDQKLEHIGKILENFIQNASNFDRNVENLGKKLERYKHKI